MAKSTKPTLKRANDRKAAGSLPAEPVAKVKAVKAASPKTPDFLTALASMSVSQLAEVIARAEQLRGEKVGDAKKSFLEETIARAAELGVNMKEFLVGKPEKKGKAGKVAAASPARASPAVKYHDPESGSTWSGRGRIATWLKDAEAAGKSRDEYLVK